MKKGRQKCLAILLLFAMVFGMLPARVTKANSFGSLIDVWDFGAQQLDPTIYHNRLSKDVINSWYPGVTTGPEVLGKYLDSFSVDGGDFVFSDGGFTSKHRLRSTNTELIRYDSKSLIDGNGNLYNGYLYSDKSNTADVYLGIQLEKNDILTLVVASNGNPSKVVLEAPSNTKQIQQHTLGSTNASVLTYYASEAGLHKIYALEEKLVIARVYRQHTSLCTVTGTITAPTELTTSYSIVFKNNKTGEEITAPVADGRYQVTLNDTYDYSVHLQGADGFVISEGDFLFIQNGETQVNHNITVEDVPLMTLTGTISGLSSEQLQKVELSFLPVTHQIYVPSVVIDRETGSYTAILEKNITYVVSAVNVNDYSLDLVEYTGSMNETKELLFSYKPVYKINLNLVGLTTQEADEAVITFTNINEVGYSYQFTGTDNIMLRNGTYSLTINSPKYQRLTSHLVVSDNEVNKTVEFDKPTNWIFSNPNFTPQGTLYNFYGLSLANVNKDKEYAVGNLGSQIQIPVDGPCIITFSFCYKASAIINNDEVNGNIVTNSGSTSKIETLNYQYQGSDSKVTVDFKGMTYLTKIEISPIVPIKTTLTVGPSGCDYTTINDALAAVKIMQRTDSERITIEIQPGNYEEMLLIDVPNVTLKNASPTPSLDLRDKGVNIGADAVRITSYYGHGYSYYSMGSNYKWDEATLNVNRENGSPSTTNKGAGDATHWNATVVVAAKGFQAEGIIFENSFNQYISQKEAADILILETENKGVRPKVAGDTSVQNKSFVERAAALAIANGAKEVYFDQCRFVGRQDTLYGGSDVKAAFNKCIVMGACDYIFGPMTAVFYKCDLVMNTSEGSTDVAYITAAQQSTGRGFLMYNCTIKSTTPGVDTASEKTSKPGYFGRPWRANTSEVVFHKTIIEPTNFNGTYESLIHPLGWLNTLSATSPGMYEYGTMEVLANTNHSTSRASWATLLTTPVLADQTDISTADDAMTAFLGEWRPFVLDATDDTAVIFHPETPVVTPVVHTWDVTTLDATGVVDKASLAEGIYANYFKVVGSVIQRVSLDKITSIELGKDNSGSIQFTVTGIADVTIDMSSTGGTNISAVGLLDLNDNLITEKTNITTVTGTARTQLTYTGLPAGTYKIVSPTSSYNRGARLYKVSVSEVGGTTIRKDWSEVSAPIITGTQIIDGKIIVNFSMDIGKDGADTVILTMKKGAETIQSQSYASNGASGYVTFTPSESGDYRFSITAYREEQEKTGTDYVLTGFSLPLGKPVIQSAISVGNGSIKVSWNQVKEAQKYEVSYKMLEATEFSTPTVVTTTDCILSGLIVGATYNIRVKAIRGSEYSEDTTMAKVSNEVQRAWYFSAFGSGVNTTNNFYRGNAIDGNVNVVSQNGNGKLVPATTDGLAFYYTKIDAANENFILKAKVTVDTWTYSNGQEGFGLMAADAVGVHGDSSEFWNNSYMASVSKIEYNWDKENQKVSDTGDKITMKLGVGAQEKIGVTAENIADGTIKTKVTELFSSKIATLETSCANNGAGTYNLVGNFTTTNIPGGTIANPRTTFDLAIQRDNTGYRISYTDPSGKTITKLYYDLDRDALTQIDKENIYVGFFASRNANITVSDIQLSVSDPKTDPPAQGREITKVNLIYGFQSTTAIGTKDHDLVFRANADGLLTIVGLDGKAKQQQIKANTNIVNHVTLSKGNNTFYGTFTPDKDYKPGEFEELVSYETVSFTHTVLYKNYGQSGQSIYVAPNGTPNGNGTKKSPLDIYTAVKHVQPGQTIVLAGGIYSLTSTVKVERGINGTATNKIFMVADPTATTRPVFDFNGACAGMVLAGDYWYFKGFDVTKSQDAQKGIQVSGSYCVLDQVNAYHNGNTGIQISRYLSTDAWEDWPCNNLILNCTSYGNADRGYEDADGFAAKLTVAEGNVFDGCIAYNNADDGWDLFAKAETGPIGDVLIRNCVAYNNGYLLDGTNAGNGNGFKMGGSSIAGKHRLENSVAFGNKAKGIDSNSGPNIEVINCTSFNNASFNVALYTNDAVNTDYYATGIISYRQNTNVAEQLKLKGTQDENKVYQNTNYYWDVVSSSSRNKVGDQVSSDWFESLTFNQITRNPNGTINMNHYLVLTNQAPMDAGARISGIPSNHPVIGPEVVGEVKPQPPTSPTLVPTLSPTPTVTPTPTPTPIPAKVLTKAEILKHLTPKRTGTLYIGGSINIGSFGINLPKNVVIVNDFKKETLSKLKQGEIPIQITYQTKDSKVVRVNQKGRLTALKAGVAVITATVTMQDGTKELYTRKITVKEASILFVESTIRMKVGEEKVFEVLVHGYDKASIIWKSSKIGGVVVTKNKGKTTAIIKAVSPKTDWIYVTVDGVMKKIKVVIE